MSRLTSIFMGTPEIAVPVLRTLARCSEVQLVVTQPDRPAGRGQRLATSPIKDAATQLGLTLFQPESLKPPGSAQQLPQTDVVVVMAYGELLRQEVLDRPRFGCFNLHASLLPRWRGASPLQAALRAGDARTGVTMIRMVRALDAGGMYGNLGIALHPDTTLPQLHDEVASTAARLLEDFVGAWPPGQPIPQDETGVTVCRKLTSDDGHLDFALTAVELERWVRAYTPAPGCWSMAGSVRMRILAVVARPGITGLAPGQVRAERELLVGCGDGACAIVRLQLPGGRVQEAADFLNGHQPPTQLN